MQLDDSTLWRNNTKLVSRSCYISRIGHRIFSFQQTIRGGWWPDIERDKMEWNRMSPKRFDQFAICYCEAKFQYRIQSLQNVCNLCSTRSVLSLTSLRYRYVAVPRLERVSRSDYAHEENPSLISRVGGACEESFEQYLAIVSLHGRFKLWSREKDSSVED